MFSHSATNPAWVPAAQEAIPSACFRIITTAYSAWAVVIKTVAQLKERTAPPTKNLKAALKSFFTWIMDEIAMCNVKCVACNDKHRVHCFGFTAHNFTVLVQSQCSCQPGFHQQRAAVFSGRALINLVSNNCPEPNNRQQKVGDLVKRQIFCSGGDLNKPDLKEWMLDLFYQVDTNAAPDGC